MAHLNVKIDDTLTVPSPGLGCMGLSQLYGKADDEQSKEVLSKAIDLGMCFWNTASIYGQGHNERLLGSVLAEGNNRDKVWVVTKWGISPDRGLDGSPAFAKKCLEDSLNFLGGPPTAWLLHRIDPNTPVEESVKAMEEARQAGKTRFIGLSGMSEATLRRAAKVAKIDFIETEFSPTETSIETNGLLSACKELGVKILAYSPLGSGFVTGAYRSHSDFMKDGDARGTGFFPRLSKENFENNFKFVEAWEKVASSKGCTPAQLALAWVSQVYGDLIIPIPGTKSIKRLEENWAARNVQLDEEDFKAIRKVIEDYPLVGDQLAPEQQQHLGR
ncbi:hypothetical protein JCM8547_008533 [Rhodosporidiobolus lusitaniae]